MDRHLEIDSEFLSRWHRIVADKDLGALREILSPAIKLGAPPYWGDLEGRDLVTHLLGIIVTTIEDFTYHREWVDGRELALEFRGRVGKLELQGIDLITLDEAGHVARLDVVIRPMNALEALREVVATKMADYLASEKR
jgi:hypothetical protein